MIIRINQNVFFFSSPSSFSSIYQEKVIVHFGFTCVQCREDCNSIEQQVHEEFRSCLQQLPLMHGHHTLCQCRHPFFSSTEKIDKSVKFENQIEI